MRQKPIALTHNIGGLLLAGALVAARPAPRGNPAPVSARLSEWTIKLSETTVPAGPVKFTVTNGGSIPHAFEVEGQGTEHETLLIQPGASTTLTFTLEPGKYEVYCPVGEDSHKKLGMEAHLVVVGAGEQATSEHGAMAEQDVTAAPAAFGHVHLQRVGQGRDPGLGRWHRGVHHTRWRALEGGPRLRRPRTCRTTRNSAA
jgi:plastocyanin